MPHCVWIRMRNSIPGKFNKTIDKHGNCLYNQTVSEFHLLTIVTVNRASPEGGKGGSKMFIRIRKQFDKEHSNKITSWRSV